MIACPLCDLAGAAAFAQAHGRSFLRCERCLLTFVDPRDRLSCDDERARYDTHDNRPDDPGYRAFLDRLAEPLTARLPAGAEGLDYGSGPGPTLSVMMAERGFSVSIYDPFFAPDPAALGRSWDFITCTETAEHFFRPGEEFRRLDGLLREPGWLGLMTQVLEAPMSDDPHAFESWWYVRDPTHVSFYRPETLEWIATTFGWTMTRVSSTVTIYQKG